MCPCPSSHFKLIWINFNRICINFNLVVYLAVAFWIYNTRQPWNACFTIRLDHDPLNFDWVVRQSSYLVECVYPSSHFVRIGIISNPVIHLAVEYITCLPWKMHILEPSLWSSMISSYKLLGWFTCWLLQPDFINLGSNLVCILPVTIPRENTSAFSLSHLVLIWLIQQLFISFLRKYSSNRLQAKAGAGSATLSMVCKIHFYSLLSVG